MSNQQQEQEGEPMSFPEFAKSVGVGEEQPRDKTGRFLHTTNEAEAREMYVDYTARDRETIQNLRSKVANLEEGIVYFQNLYGDTRKQLDDTLRAQLQFPIDSGVAILLVFSLCAFILGYLFGKGDH